MCWKRQLPIGAECVPTGGVHFRVWAPKRSCVEVVFDDDEVHSCTLTRDTCGYFAALALEGKVGARYRLRLDGGSDLYPDPASRFQPDGPHGPSEVIDPAAFDWTAHHWPGVAAPGARIIYELHVGTFTSEGTWESAARELEELARIGITIIEVMPIADFPGEFGWGYDGVDMFAPSRLYGRPDDFRRFVDRAHAEGIAVILDVVYNHFGPDGCYLREFSDAYFSARYKNEWGDPINFDDDRSGPVREFFAANAAHWIREYRLDGLRLDATQQIFDRSERHVIAEIVAAAHRAAPQRRLLIVCENEPQDARLVRDTSAGGYGADALWNDDFHHAALVALTGHSEAYYSDYAGSPQELVSSVKHGFLYQGQRSHWQEVGRGSAALDLAPCAFVHFLENHDQVANSAYGHRLARRTSPGRYRALTALLLLSPQTPMLFQGQEFASSRPFLYFADHAPAVAESVERGRAEFLAQFPPLATPRMRALFHDPADRATFERCKLDLSERAKHAEAYALHRDLLHLRRTDRVLNRACSTPIDGCVLGPSAFAIRYGIGEASNRLLLINLGRDLELSIAPEPLLAPCSDAGWSTLWSSEDPRYGGGGIAHTPDAGPMFLPGEAALVLTSEPAQ